MPHDESRLTRQRWYGLKAPLKQAMSYRPLHDVMKVGGRRFLSDDQVARLPAPAQVREVTARMGGTSFVMEKPSRCILAKELYWGQGRRPNGADQTALDLFAALVPTATTVFDIGSYTGIFSLLSASVSKTVQVHAFEVVPEVFLAAWSNVLRNDLVGRVQVHLGAVGSSEPLSITRGSGGSALPDFLSAETASASLHSGDSVTVPGVTMRELEELVTGDRVLMKMDIEGGEPAALAAGADFLANLHPDILCEVLPSTETAGMTEQLSALGYSFYSVGDHRLTRHDRITGLAAERDWLFTTKPGERLRELLASAGITLTDR